MIFFSGRGEVKVCRVFYVYCCMGGWTGKTRDDYYSIRGSYTSPVSVSLRMTDVLIRCKCFMCFFELYSKCFVCSVGPI